jgi:hypothetical protein
MACVTACETTLGSAGLPTAIDVAAVATVDTAALI